MIIELKLIPISAEGCATGVVDEDVTPIFKPWRSIVSKVYLDAAMGGLKCSGGHLHRRCSGGQRVAQIAYYSPALCEALHKGLDANEDARVAALLDFKVSDANCATTSPGLRVSEAMYAATSPGRRVSKFLHAATFPSLKASMSSFAVTSSGKAPGLRLDKQGRA